MQTKNYCLTHHDLDGVCAYIVLSQVIKFEKVHPCGYKTLEKKIDMLCKGEVGNTLYITDLALTIEQLERLSEVNKIIFIDHHEKYEQSEMPNNVKCYTSKSMSATKLCLHYVTKFHEYDATTEINRLVFYANDYDMWQHKKIESIYMNELFWHHNFWKFNDIYATGIHSYHEEGLELGRDIYEQRLIEAEASDKFLIDDRICVSFEIGLLNYITLKHEDHLDGFLCIINKQRISVRSKHDMTDFYAAVNEQYDVESCGGHANAGGIAFNIDLNDDNIESIGKLLLEKAVDK
jgi:single-stranded DNA-specific DHH superfamily exonuclease